MTDNRHEGSANPLPDAPGEVDASSRVSVLDHALWQQLSSADSWEDAAAAWLTLMCRMIPQVERGVLVLADEQTDAFTPAAVWPHDENPTPELSATVEFAIAERRGVLRGDDDRGEDASMVSAAIAYPVLVGDTLHGVAAVEVANSRGHELRTAMRQLQWGVAWVRDWIRKRAAEREQRVLERTTLALELVADVLEEERFAAACRASVTALALRLRCDRVSVGFRKRGYTAVTAISHSAQFGERMNLVRLLGVAMDEAIDQRTVLLYPSNDEEAGYVTRGHNELARLHSAETVLTIPLLVRDEYVGALTAERSTGHPFDQATIDELECVAAILGPILDEKRRNDRWVISKLGESVAGQLARMLGPGFLGRKLVAAALLIVVSFFYFAKTEYRISADAQIEGLVQRVIVASFDGFIKEAPVRAGDTLKAGELMASLDDRDLALERLRWVTERQTHLHEYGRALGERKRAESNIIKTQVEQADAHIQLIDEQLARAKLVAPFDGIVVSGDLSQSVGAAVARGEVLFEIAPLNAYRVILRVDETQIADVDVGQRGQLLTSSLLDAPFPIVIEKITPVAESNEGRNFFRVDARLDAVSPRLRPGMQGVGKIDVESRRLIWIWTRTFSNWLRIQVWKWWS